MANNKCDLPNVSQLSDTHNMHQLGFFFIEALMPAEKTVVLIYADIIKQSMIQDERKYLRDDPRRYHFRGDVGQKRRVNIALCHKVEVRRSGR